MKIFASKFPNDRYNRKIKYSQKRENVNFSELASVKINCDEVSHHDNSNVTTGGTISTQEKNDCLPVFHDDAESVTRRPNKTKNLSLGKGRAHTVKKLKELRVVLKRLPEVWLRKGQTLVSRIRKFPNGDKCTSENIAVKPDFCSDVNKISCFQKQSSGIVGSLSTQSTVFCREFTSSSVVQDTGSKNNLPNSKTYPEFLVKELYVSLHKLPSNLHSYSWSQIEHTYQRCKVCHSIGVSRINQENSSCQTTSNMTNEKQNIMRVDGSSHKNFSVLGQRRARNKGHKTCLFCSEDHNRSADHNILPKKYTGYESVKTITPYVPTEKDFSEDEMDCSDTAYILAKERTHTIGNQMLHTKELWRMRKISPMELIQAVKYAIHLSLTEPWLQLNVSGPPECCESRHRSIVLHRMKPNIAVSQLFRDAVFQRLWLPAFSLLATMISAGGIPRPEDVQTILLFIMTTEDQRVKKEGLMIIETLFRSFPPCCLHTISYYSAVFTKPHKVGCQESNGLLLSMIAVLSSQLSSKAEMASDLVSCSADIIKVVVSALAADLASWLSRHQTKKCTEAKYDVPLAKIALGQMADTQIHVNDLKIIMELCVCDWRTTLQHNVFMDVIHLIAEVYRIRYAVPLKEYPGLGTDCHLLASEIVSQIEQSGMESESIGQFLCILKPNWLSMLVSQKLLEKLQGPLHGSVLDTVTSYMLEYQDLLKREITYAEHYGKHKISSDDREAKKANKRDHKGEVQLHRSCRRGNINVVNRLLSVPGIDVNISDNAGWTPLHEAVCYGHTACAQALLNFVPSPGSPYVYTAARADCGTTPLISAAVAGDADMCHLLLQHAGIVLLEDILEGDDIKPQLKEDIPEEIQSLLKTAKLKYENIITKHLGVSLSVEIWARMCPLFVPLVCSHMATHHVPLIRRQLGTTQGGAVHIASTHIDYSTVQQIMRTLRSFEKMRKVIKHLCKQHEIPISAVNSFQSYF